MNIQTLLVLDSQCENALIDKHFHDQNDTWIVEHQNLFNEIIVTMKDGESKMYIEQHKNEFSFIHLLLKCYLEDGKNI